MTRSVAKKLHAGYRRFAGQLGADTSGVALIEFAFSAPIVLSMGMMGTDTALMVVTHMQVSQVAMQVADNSSRIGEQDVLTARKVYEKDVNQAMIGAEKLGENIRIFNQGRVIVSSLQRNTSGGQWIKWQRCRGAKVYTSTNGVQGDGITGTSFPGMGPASSRITASAGTAVMFVEVAYDFRSITPLNLFNNQQIVYTAAFNVRDNRDLNSLYAGGNVANCSTYSANRT